MCAGIFNNKRLLCTRTANWTNQLDVILYDNSNYGFILRFGGAGATGKQKTYKPTTNWQWYKLIMGWDRTTVNDENANGTYSTNQINNPYSIIIYAGGGDIYGQHPCTAKVSYLKIYKSSELILHFIPVRKNDIGYMYDKVSGQLFGNSGTGSFVLGPDL